VDAALQAIADARLGVFTAQEALAVGLTVDDIRAELRRHRWMRLRKGIYASSERVAAADDRERHLMDCLAVLLSLDRGPALSHASAARVHGLLLPRSADSMVRLTDDVQWRSGRGYRVARGQLPTDDVEPWLGFPATTIPRTLVDCAREWSQVDSVIALDAAMFAKQVTRAALVAAVLAARHRPGIGAAARALHLADGRAESPLETRARLRLLASGLPLFDVQPDLYDEHGFVGRLDGWYEEAAVALEFDGQVKYSDPYRGRTPAQVLWEEKRREDAVRAVDIRFVRIVSEDLGAPWPRVVARLGNLLATPYVGPRRFRIVRNPEPGTEAA
jgi:predicted transcriptional regulator of viral defense system